MKRYVFAGLLIFFIVLLVTFPAGVAYRWFAPPDLQLSGISGSVWKGHATEGLAGGAYIRDISWRLQPAQFFTGKLAFETSSKPASGTITTDVAVAIDGSMSLSQLSGSVPLDLVHPDFQRFGIRGDLSLSFDELVIRNGLPTGASGSLVIANFFSADLSAAVLGDFRIDLRNGADAIEGTVDDVSGVVDIERATLTVNRDGSYYLIGDIAARQNAPPSVDQQLRFLPNANQPGYKQFRFEGQL